MSVDYRTPEEMRARISELENENERLKRGAPGENARLWAQVDALRKAGDALFKSYVALAESGDAGYWDWHEYKEFTDWEEVSHEVGNRHTSS